MNGSENRNERPTIYGPRSTVGTVPGDFDLKQFLRSVPQVSQPIRPTSISGLSNGLSSNKLLAALPPNEFQRLQPNLRRVSLRAGEDLYQFEASILFAYFPETAVVSHVYIMADGSTAQGAIIGREGVTGLSAIFHASPPVYSNRVLVEGNALRIRRDVLKREFSRCSALQRHILSYVSARMVQLSQRAVCGGHHRLEERMCCWLLMLHDRTGASEFRLTHELMAEHLGVRRAGVTETANLLRDRQIISYTRGRLRLLDRRKLEACACECYETLGLLSQVVKW